MSKEEFDYAVKEVMKLRSRPTNSEAMDIYGSYKQVTVGDVNIVRPGFLDFAGKTKWDAWDAKKGMSKEEAMKDYIVKVNAMIEKYGINPL